MSQSGILGIDLFKLLARALLGGFPVGRWGAKNPHDSLFVA